MSSEYVAKHDVTMLVISCLDIGQCGRGWQSFEFDPQRGHERSCPLPPKHKLSKGVENCALRTWHLELQSAHVRHTCHTVKINYFRTSLDMGTEGGSKLLL